jgi:HAD superfamily hydrolase (TIGR01549 family)
MFKAILFDLDDTLLANSIETFIPAYFQALGEYVAHLIPPERLVSEIMRATRAMEQNDGTGLTNQETFASVFYPAVGYKQEELEPVFAKFYTNEFPKLRNLTQPIPEARLLVEWAFGRGLQVVIATNPVFPHLAIEQRLDWANVPVTEFDYALVTSYENTHATKASPAYYEEVVAQLDCEPKECLMVGDDWERDMMPAATAGIPIYWITKPNDTLLPIPPMQKIKGGVLVGQGTLESLWDWIGRGGLAL